MTVDVNCMGQTRIFHDVSKVEETPTFLKITGEDQFAGGMKSVLIPLKDILEATIHEGSEK